MIFASKLSVLSRHLPFIALAALGALAACGGETDEGSTSSGSNIGVRDDADAGDANNIQEDGGSEASAPDAGPPGEEERPCTVTPTGLECPPGFQCALYDTPGEGGVCIRVPDGTAGEGERCSGTSTGTQCAPALTCGLYDTPGEGGVCFRP